MELPCNCAMLDCVTAHDCSDLAHLCRRNVVNGTPCTATSAYNFFTRMGTATSACMGYWSLHVLTTGHDYQWYQCCVGMLDMRCSNVGASHFRRVMKWVLRRAACKSTHEKSLRTQWCNVSPGVLLFRPQSVCPSTPDVWDSSFAHALVLGQMLCIAHLARMS